MIGVMGTWPRFLGVALAFATGCGSNGNSDVGSRADAMTPADVVTARDVATADVPVPVDALSSDTGPRDSGTPVTDAAPPPDTGCDASSCLSGPAGSQTFTASGTFVVPAGVTSISVVLVGPGGSLTASTYPSGGGGGGGLCYRNDIPVTPGDSLPVNVGLHAMESRDASNTSFQGITAFAGANASLGTLPGAAGGGGGDSGATCFTGGAGGSAGGSPGGGGGAAGYAGNGGHGGSGAAIGCPTDPTAGAGGGGGGGGGCSGTSCGGASGGGVGLNGIGADGAAGDSVCAGGYAGPGGGGSSGSPGGGSHSAGGPGGDFGGGGAGYGPYGADGAVRIIWGPGRSFPDHAM